MAGVLVVGATRGLGAALATKYAQKGAKVFATARGQPKDKLHDKITWIPSVDIGEESAGATVVKGLSGAKLDRVIITAGYFSLETFDEPKYDEEVKMYKICTIGPLFVVQQLVKTGSVGAGGKIVFLSSEAGSITLRHESEGGGMYGHHASKTALNMVARLLSIDLKDKDISVGMVHPGFMKTELTKSVGFDKYYEDGGAISPEEAADSLIQWTEKDLDISKTGQFWAPRGPESIGTIEQTIGPADSLPTPLQLPW